MESGKEIGLNLDNLEPDSTKSAKCSYVPCERKDLEEP